MLTLKEISILLLILTVLHKAESAYIPFLEMTRTAKIAIVEEGNNAEKPEVVGRAPAGLFRAHVREGVPPLLCAGRCAAPPAGPVCAFDARGTARTFATLCELEAVSCRESTYYAITSLGEC